MSEGRAGQDWSEQEIDLIVADYFAMLAMELRGERYVKAHRNAELQRLTGRRRGAIEFKHENISAVLRELGEPWIRGYMPMPNYQNALVDGVERYLDARTVPIAPTKPAQGLSEDAALFIGPAPLRTVRTTPEMTRDLERLVRKFDPAARDAKNRALGKSGEERVLRSERARLRAAGRDDLARKVRWVAEEEGDGAGYDILSFAGSGETRFLEVKTTAGPDKTPFYVSSNEKAFSEERPAEFRIFRLYDFAREPKAFLIAPPLGDHLNLTAANYRAAFR
ncbi:hypothetical protein HNP73_004022 [Amaricoccus macauensis]|uniref:Protein NO VEIN C-terminal domain-containing protein n=1 Tax=Amaricoccus macauensis TaxID=57001 RepID=A0A840SY77_9RHOB|nr:hypothetical protein [Amaricoccus macauensis]